MYEEEDDKDVDFLQYTKLWIDLINRGGLYRVNNDAYMLASVPGLPRYAIYCARLIVRGRETLKTGKAWDETSRAHRRWVDAGSHAPRCLDRKYVYTRERSTAKLLADSYM